MIRLIFKKITVYLLSLITTLCALHVQADILTFYHNDATGSPIAATDVYGNVLWTERREPFGEPKLNQSAKDNHRVDYTGHVYDKELGLHYQGRRFYDPVIGRFLSVDPVGFYEENIQSFNRYAYANNNPYKFHDPDGRVPLLLAPVIATGIGYLLTPNVANSPTHTSVDQGNSIFDFVPAALAGGAAGVGAKAIGKRSATSSIAKEVLSKGDRIKMIVDSIGKINAKNADEALKQVNQIVDRVEDAHSGVKKVKNPGKAF